MNKTLVLAGLALAFSARLFASPMGSAADITFVVGSGANRANLVLDFNDGKTREAFAWGYLFDAPVSGAAMLMDIAAADANLSVTHGGTTADGFYVTAISYNDGVDAHSSASFGYYIDGGTAGGNAVAGGGAHLPSSWTLSPTGAADSSFGSPGRFVADGAWDAWSAGNWGPAPDYTPPPAPAGDVYAAVPEPSVFAALMLGGLLLYRFHRRRG